MGKGRAPCCDKSKVKKGPWSSEEDLRLITFIQKHGHGNWRSLPKQAGLLRCGKSCRLRWINYLRPDVKRGNFTPQEEATIVKLHQSFGNKWSKIASYLPGRTDNEIKNVWNTHLKKRLMKKIDGNQAKDGRSCVSPPFSPSSSTSVVSHTNWSQDISTKANEVEFKDDMLTEKEPKEATKSCSPTTSYGSNLSNLSQVEISSPKGLDMDNWILSPKVHDIHDDGVIEIPSMESDIDFWDMLDILDPSPTTTTTTSNSDSKQDNQPVCQGVSDSECQKWLRYLENELGLSQSTGANCYECTDAVTSQDKEAHPFTT